MSHVASLELSIELYKVSGWETDDWVDPFDNSLMSREDRDIIEYDNDGSGGTYPAYSLGYLLRKLPNKRIKLRNNSQEGWGCQYDPQRDRNTELTFYADNPEDATIKLCVELFKQGILK